MLLRIGKDSIISLEAVLLEELLVTVLMSKKFHSGTQPTCSVVPHLE